MITCALFITYGGAAGFQIIADNFQCSGLPYTDLSSLSIEGESLMTEAYPATMVGMPISLTLRAISCNTPIGAFSSSLTGVSRSMV